MSERVVVITGASGGIGEAIAHALDKKGAALVLAARRGEELARVAADCRNARTVTADVTRRADVERIRDEALAAFGHIDVWINNAGRGISRSVLDLTDDDVDAMIATNVKSALYGMQAVIPHFKERGTGHLINVSSFLGRVPMATIRSVYSASKAALNSLTANLRMELRATHPNIHVTTLLPGIVSTEFAQNTLGKASGSPPTSGPFAAQTAEQVANVVAELLEHPEPEVFTNPILKEVWKKYAEDVSAFEAQLAQRASP